MIAILEILKDGHLVSGYRCTDGQDRFILTKLEVIEYLSQGQVTNARLLEYNGSRVIKVYPPKAEKPAVQIPGPPVNTYVTATVPFNSFYNFL